MEVTLHFTHDGNARAFRRPGLVWSLAQCQSVIRIVSNLPPLWRQAGSERESSVPLVYLMSFGRVFQATFRVIEGGKSDLENVSRLGRIDLL